MIHVRLATKAANNSEKTIIVWVRRLPSEMRPKTLLAEKDAVAMVISSPTPVSSSPQRKRKPTAMKRNVLVYVTSQRRPVAVDITGEAIGTK